MDEAVHRGSSEFDGLPIIKRLGSQLIGTRCFVRAGCLRLGSARDVGAPPLAFAPHVFMSVRLGVA